MKRNRSILVLILSIVLLGSASAGAVRRSQAAPGTAPAAAPVLAASFPDPTPDGQRALTPTGPSGIVIAPNGRVYAAVYKDDRVYSWASTGAMLGGGAPDKTFGADNGDPDAECTNGPSATLMCGPESVAVDAGGNLYVADTYNHRVLVFQNPDTDATPLTADRVFGQPDLTSNQENYDSNGGDTIVEGFCFVRGLAIDSAGNLFVTDESNHRVLRFDGGAAGDSLPDLVLGKDNLDATNPCPTYDSGQTTRDRLNWPLGVAVDDAGSVYVTDLRNSRVLRFDAPLEDGEDAAEVYLGFDFPHDVAIDNAGNVYVADTENDRVRVFAAAPDGDTEPDHAFTGLDYPMGMAFDSAGNFFVASCGSPTTYRGYPPCTQGARAIVAFNAPPPTNPDALALTVDAAAGQRAISPYIYGMNLYGLDPATFQALADELNLPVQRWGGNITTRYNWQNDMANHGSDWFFENIPEDNPDPANGNAADHSITRGKATGADSLITIPMIGYVSKDQTNPGGGYDCSYDIVKYNYTPAPLYPGGPATDPENAASANCGTGLRTNGTFVTGNETTDTSIVVDQTFMQDWVQHIVDKFGTAAQGGVPFYGLDNEPGLWHETHRDVHPDHLGYEELRNLTIQYATAIKAVDPGAQTLGPVQDGWTRYFYSSYSGYPDNIAEAERAAHGGQPFVEWYLDEMKAYQDQNGTRLLDYFDLHYYPQADGVSLSPAGDAATQALRLRSTRSLWDPTYIDESWIEETEEGNIAVQLLPRMRAWVNTHYPGTKLAISEYNWGALDHINGALAQADVLGIFGREGLDLATLWEPPQPDDPGAFAFRMYRNYDGQGAGFGETSLTAGSADQGKVAIYAARRGSDGALTLMIVNKTTTEQAAQVGLSGFTPSGNAAVYRYSAANLAAIVRQADQSVQSGGFSATLPAESITLVVVPGAGGPIEGQSTAYLPFILR